MYEDTSPLLTDLYQLNMIQAYLDHGETKTAVFEFFVRKFPARRGFLVAAGLEQALDFLEDLRFSGEEIEWLGQSGRFGKELLDYLAKLRFTGDVHAMPEGAVFFADEPILRVTAPLPQAQLLETRLINILHFQSLIASKAARMMLAAPGKLLVDFYALYHAPDTWWCVCEGGFGPALAEGLDRSRQRRWPQTGRFLARPPGAHGRRQEKPGPPSRAGKLDA